MVHFASACGPKCSHGRFCQAVKGACCPADPADRAKARTILVLARSTDGGGAVKPQALLNTAQWRTRWYVLSFQLLVLAAAVVCARPAFALSPAKMPTQYVHAS